MFHTKDAYDNVERAAILKGMLRFGLSGRIYSSNAKILTDRTSYMSMQEGDSPRHTLHRGVPHEAILSPTFF